MASVDPSRAPLSHFELLEELTQQDLEVLQLLARAVRRGLFKPSTLATALATMQHDTPWEVDGEWVATPEMVKVLGIEGGEDIVSAADQTLAMAAGVALMALESRQRVQGLSDRLDRLTTALQGAGAVLSVIDNPAQP